MRDDGINKTVIRKILTKHGSVLGVDGFRDFTFELLGNGENNRNYLVVVGKERFTLRVTMKSDLEKNMSREFRMLGKVPCGIAPVPLVFDDAKDVVNHPFSVLSFIEGRTIQKWNMKHIDAFARLTAQLHQKTPMKGCGRFGKKKLFRVSDRFRQWEEEYKKELQIDGLGVLFDKFKKSIRAKEKIFLSNHSFCLVHNDACRDNVIFHQGKAFLVDWEWSEYGDCSVDLAMLFFEGGAIAPWRIFLSKRAIEFLVDAYKKHRGCGFVDDSLLQRVLLYHDITNFGDMLYFAWKIDNFASDVYIRPKRMYLEAYMKCKSYFESRYA